MIESRPNLLTHAGRHLLSRRHFFGQTVSSLSAVALTQLLAQERLLASESSPRLHIDPSNPHAPRKPHFSPRAKSVLVIFCAGACSQLETWDYKPELIKQNGKPLPGGPSVTFQGPAGDLAQPQYKFRPRGECGKKVSDMIPHLGELVDDFAFIHTLTSKSNTHGPAENFLSTGFVQDGFPSIGAWLTYALGTENQNLPAFVAIPDPRGVPQASVNNWGPGFLPAVFQGTPFSSSQPILNLLPPPSISPDSDVAARELLRVINGEHLKQNPGDSDLAARIASYELAAKMQLSVPEISDLSSEPGHILRMYGADDTEDDLKAGYARNCILARRLVEKGVRFVQLFNGAYASGGKLNWDGHQALREQYDTHGRIMDQPSAALIRDLKQRGLLDNTLVVWCTEFGRMPMFQKGAKGRDHNPNGFTAVLAGAGVKRGVSYGATDELGFKAVENVSSVHDLNATILHLLGLDHERLTFRNNGIDRRLTDVHGHVIREILA
ncbi:MAG: DUF1501 domain-containing protein [Planctomycetaceae bacterium]|nr:DUF1501 domain-containing protein [Planctomycetales bacterium]MCB9921974.1 DUF1501 domain-containing protein [Planctomycetaceae bacterium]